MAGAKKTFKKVFKKKELKRRFLPDPTDKRELEKSNLNPIEATKIGLGDVGDVFTPDIPEPEEDTIIPLPDESSARLNARRRQAKKKKTGRSSTILTEGLGG